MAGQDKGRVSQGTGMSPTGVRDRSASGRLVISRVNEFNRVAV